MDQRTASTLRKVARNKRRKAIAGGGCPTNVNDMRYSCQGGRPVAGMKCGLGGSYARKAVAGGPMRPNGDPCAPGGFYHYDEPCDCPEGPTCTPCLPDPYEEPCSPCNPGVPPVEGSHPVPRPPAPPQAPPADRWPGVPDPWQMTGQTAPQLPPPPRPPAPRPDPRFSGEPQLTCEGRCTQDFVYGSSAWQMCMRQCSPSAPAPSPVSHSTTVSIAGSPSRGCGYRR